MSQSQGVTKCTRGKFGLKCNRLCHCDWNAAISCHQRTGKCLCKEGFQGPSCEEDINECHSSVTKVCPGKHTSCKNIRGSYKCQCQTGYRKRTKSGHCTYCLTGYYGDECLRRCSCKWVNTINCHFSTGECICKPGWEGEKCSQSVDDCSGNPCSGMVCIDLHRSYACICGENKRFVRGECKVEIVDFISYNLKPNVGEWVNIYFLFSLDPSYNWNHFGQPNYVYRLVSDNDPDVDFVSCKVDFHKQAKRVLGNEDFIRKLKSNTVYQFYIGIFIRLLRPNKITVRAIPEVKEYTEKVLVFDATISDISKLNCLNNVSIVNGSSDIRKPTKYHQGNFNRFVLSYLSNEHCNEIPTVEWSYYRVPDKIRSHPENCMLQDSLTQLDPAYLVWLISQAPISNQDDIEEVMPSNSLPAGILYLCVLIYLRNIRSSNVVDCFETWFLQIEKKNTKKILNRLNSYSSVEYITCYGPIGNFLIQENATFGVYKSQLSNPSKKEVYSFKHAFIEIVQNPRLSGYFIPPVSYLIWGRTEDLEIGTKLNILDGTRAHSVEVSFGATATRKCAKYVNYGHALVYYKNDMPVDEYCAFKMTARIRNHPHTELKHNLGVTFKNPYRALNMHVECVFGCKETIGTSEILHYILRPSLSLDEHVQRSKVDITWSVKENSNKVNKTRQDEIMYDNFGLLTTKAQTLLPGTVYEFTADYSVTSLTKSSLKHTRSGMLIVKIRTKGAPTGNGCRINPTTGLPVITSFSVICDSYVDTEYNQTLLYRLYQLVTLPNGENVYTVIAYGNKPTMDHLTLSGSMKDGVFPKSTELKVEIANIAKSFTSVYLNVSFKSVEQNDLIKLVSHKIQNLTISNQGDLRTVKDLATIINSISTDFFKEKIKIRNELLHLIKDVTIKSFETLEIVSYILMSLSDRENEMEEEGLNDGVETIANLTKKLITYATTNFNTAEHVAKLQTLATSPLLSKSSDLGKSTEHQEMNVDTKKSKWKQNMKRGLKITKSVKTISNILLKGLAVTQKSVRVLTEHLDVEVKTSDITKTTFFKLMSSDGRASFNLPGTSLGAGVSKIDTELESYKKNPFAGTSESVFGDLPLININFHEHNQTTVDKRTFRFSQPADIFLEFNNSATAVTLYDILVQLQEIQGEMYITRSACVFLSIPASSKEATILNITSVENFELSLKARYSNVISSFDFLYDQEMLSYPLSKIEIMNSSKGTVIRDRNLLFLPMLHKSQMRKNIKFYRVMIRLKLLQKFKLKEALDNSNMTYYNTTVIITPFKMSCLHFDRDANKFLSDKCLLTMFSSLHQLHCQCVVAAAFTGSYIVLPRLIDPLDVGLFLKIFENPLAVSMVIALWMIALATFLYGRRKDKEDEIKRGVTVLDDNREDHSFVYLICVVTGWFARASTTSNVFIVLKGSWDRSESHILNDSKRKLFQSGEENWFVLTTRDDLGEIESIEVWTDFSGGHPSWYLNCVYVQNMLSSESWLCIYNNWFSCEFGDRKLRADIPAVKERDFIGRKLLQFTVRSKHDIRNDHLWIGMIAKTSHNRFTRVRRIITGLTMLQTLMIVNLMFFGIRDFDDSRQFIQILDYKVHLISIIIGIETSIIITIVGLSVTFLFNGVAPKPAKTLEDELTEEEKELVRTNIERHLFNVTHPVNVELNNKSDMSVVTEILSLEDQQVKEASFLNMFQVKTNEIHISKNTSQNFFGEGEFQQETESIANIFVSETDYVNENRTAKNCFLLPWWFIYITWITLAIFNVFLAYYIMLYGLSLGYEKSVDWTIAFFTGFFTDILICQPIKVVLIAFVLILILKQRYTLRDQAPVAKHKESLELLYHHLTFKKKLGIKTKNIVYQIPLNSSDFQEVLERLKIESLAREMMRDFLLYVVFMCCILLVAYGNLDVYTRYQQIQFAKNVYLGVRDPLDWNDEGDDKLAEIHTASEMWEYLTDVLLQRIAPDGESNNLPEATYLLGPARLRQARVKPISDACSNLPETIRNVYNTEFCIQSIESGIEERNTFVNTWSKLYEGNADDLEDSPYVYKSSDQIRTVSFVGQHGTYSGGGYVVNISREDLNIASQTLQKVQESDWLDRYTRCIILEFTVYNPSSDLFTNVILAFEIDVTGGIFPYYSVSAARFYMDSARKDDWLQIAEGITGICVLFYTVLEIYITIEKGLSNYLKSFWNLLEIAVLSLSYVVGVLYLLRLIAYMDAINTFNMYGHARFIDFQTVFYRNFLFNTSMGVLGALAIFKMLKVITFNPFMVTYTKTMETISSGFIAFTGVSAIYLLAFSMSGIVLFGSYIFGYVTIDRALFSLLFFILGEADYENLISANRVFGPVFFLIVLIVTQYIIINFFVAILREGLELARYMSYDRENATIKYMLRVILLSFGVAPENIRKLNI